MSQTRNNSSASAVQTIELPELEARAGGARLLDSRTALLDSIGVDVSIVVGQAHTTVGHLMNLKQADILKIDRNLDQPVDIVVNGNIVARGLLVVVDDSFGVQVTEVAAAVQA